MMKDIDAMQDRIQDEDLTDIINSFESVLRGTGQTCTSNNQDINDQRKQPLVHR